MNATAPCDVCGTCDPNEPSLSCPHVPRVLCPDCAYHDEPDLFISLPDNGPVCIFCLLFFRGLGPYACKPHSEAYEHRDAALDLLNLGQRHGRGGSVVLQDNPRFNEHEWNDYYAAFYERGFRLGALQRAAVNWTLEPWLPSDLVKLVQKYT